MASSLPAAGARPATIFTRGAASLRSLSPRGSAHCSRARAELLDRVDTTISPVPTQVCPPQVCPPRCAHRRCAYRVAAFFYAGARAELMGVSHRAGQFVVAPLRTHGGVGVAEWSRCADALGEHERGRKYEHHQGHPGPVARVVVFRTARLRSCSGRESWCGPQATRRRLHPPASRRGTGRCPEHADQKRRQKRLDAVAGVHPEIREDVPMFSSMKRPSPRSTKG